MAAFLGPYPRKAGPASLLGRGHWGEPFRGFSLQTWERGPSPLQRSSGQTCPGPGPDPGEGNSLPLGARETPQLQGAGLGPLTAGHRGPRKQHQECPAGTQHVLVTDLCATRRPTGRALLASSGRRGGCEAEGGTLPGSRPPTSPLTLPAGLPSPRLPPASPCTSAKFQFPQGCLIKYSFLLITIIFHL